MTECFDGEVAQSTSGIDRQGWRHCYECGARADVLRYDTYYTLAECRDCGEESYIPKKCATAFGEFREFVERTVNSDTERSGGDPGAE